MKRHLILAVITILLAAPSALAAKRYMLSSPSGLIVADIGCGDGLTYSVKYGDRQIIAESPLSLRFTDGSSLGANLRIAKVLHQKSDKVIPSPFTQSESMTDRYNGLILKTKKGWDIEFRAYDDGVAYRFIHTENKPLDILSEQVEFIFPADFHATTPYVRSGSDEDLDSQFFNSFENCYTETQLSEMNPKRLSFLPVALDSGNGIKVVIMETDLKDYPGLFLYNPDKSNSLKGLHAPYPTVVADGGYNNIQSMVLERADYIAKIDGPRPLPWRIIVIGSDKDLASTNLSYLLAEPSQIDDISWIKPGKVAWDWWNNWNITGVDFEAGVNTPTYKHYVDFASENGIEYVILDDGWAVGKGEDLMQINPDIDLPEIISYANEKKVGIILWAGFRAFERDLENVCRHYSEMGVKGFKVDFEDRDDQLMTAFNHKAAEIAARYHLVLDLHGSYKPAGLNRTWPNVLNFEGVNGLENMKWTDLDKFDIISYDVRLPFIRQAAGPMDYTQGAMNNASRNCFRPINDSPMSPGTRAHQMALYMILHSPLNMLCDSPTNYRREQECTDFIASVPTVWDETIVLDGKMGEYIIMARRKGNEWFLGGITDWTPREINVDLTSLNLTAGSQMTIFTDGVNAGRNGNDYKRENRDIDGSSPLKINMAAGGGFAARITNRPSDSK